MRSSFKGTKLTALLLLGVSCLVCYFAAQSFMSMWEPEKIYPLEEFQEARLSDYFEGIKGTPADQPVFIQEGEEEGGTVLLLCGTHPNEPASNLTGVLFLENAKVEKGRMIVVPTANVMGFTHNGPQEGHPQGYTIETADGTDRFFPYGNRLSNPIYQWPDPDIYIHPSSGQNLSGKERSNLNRCYPGSPKGSITEKMAYAIMELIRKEKVDLAFDLHEASPEYPVVNAIVAHEKSMELAAMVTMEIEFAGIPIRLEPSPKNLHGLSHREWGDYTGTMPILMETGNPSQGRLRGKTDENLVITGEDKCYSKAMELGKLYIPYDGDQPISLRVARHTEAINLFLANLEFIDETKAVKVSGIPSFDEVLNNGVGYYLRPGEI
jgi:hypothetical protein